MKTSLLFGKAFLIVILSSLLSNNIAAQSVLTDGLSFSNPQLKTAGATDKKAGAVYLFSNVGTGIDATVTIDSLVNGATIDKIDDNSNGTGYKAAFQPEIKSGNLGMSYAVFTFRFYQSGTSNPATIQTINITPIDIDGNATLHEFAKIKAGAGAVASYMSTTTSLSITKILTGLFMGLEIAGIERGGVDTTSYANMFTVTNSAVSSFTVNFGMVTLTNSSTSRQFSLYMKGFAIPNQITLPVELIAFSAILNGDRTELKWTTASEKNVSHFVVEKSTDGKNYTDAGIVFAYGNTSDKVNYSFSDKSINTSIAGVIYYRLRSVDIDEKMQYSPVRLIRISKEMEQTISIVTYPNPVSNELRITVPSNWQGKKVSYEVLDNHGRIIIKTEPSNSSQTETLNVASLAPGFYLARVTCSGETALQKIIKR